MIVTDENIRKKKKGQAYFALALTCIIWGTTWVASKIGVRDVPALSVSYIRQFIAGTILTVYFLIKKKSLPTLKQFGWLTMMAALMFMLANGLSTWSVKYMSSGLGALIGALYPLCVALIEMIFFKTKIRGITLTGLFIGLAGVAIVFYENTFYEQPEGYSFGIMLGLIAMFSWSIGTILIARNKYNMDPYQALGWQMLIGSVLIYIMALATGNTVALADITPRTWLAIIYLIVMGSLIAFTAFIFTVKYLDPMLASIYAYINPIVAMLTGALVLKEELTLNLFIGAVITMTGVYVVNRSLRREKSEAQ